MMSEAFNIGQTETREIDHKKMDWEDRTGLIHQISHNPFPMAFHNKSHDIRMSCLDHPWDADTGDQFFKIMKGINKTVPMIENKIPFQINQYPPLMWKDRDKILEIRCVLKTFLKIMTKYPPTVLEEDIKFTKFVAIQNAPYPHDCILSISSITTVDNLFHFFYSCKKMKKLESPLRIKIMKRDVLGKGFVELQDVMGDEITIVNCARVSFGRQKDIFEEEDRRLIAYLIKNKHFSPFRHVMLRFHIRAPEFVMRQWYKHIVGAEWGTPAPFHAWNEISGRYVRMDDIYQPFTWRRQSTSSKQGSEGIVDNQEVCENNYNQSIETSIKSYNSLLEHGVAKEQARILLPLSVYTETIWTCSFQALMNFLELRLDAHAQWEIRQFAQAIESILQERLPVLFKCWRDSLVV
jgi:thymidylate synthase (FAD)